MHEGSSKGHALRFPTRKGGDAPLLKAVQPDGRQNRIHAFGKLLFSFCLRAAKGDVLCDVEVRVQDGLLEQQGDVGVNSCLKGFIAKPAFP